MASFTHGYMLLATDFELEPVIEQYLATYPDAQPREYDIVCKLRNERHEGDYCYIVVYKHVTGHSRPNLNEFIKAYCELNDKVANVEKPGNVFPELAKARFGNPAKYRK
jgi:3,4-dihydroxy-2-butanone 4-phosphate synthase